MHARRALLYMPGDSRRKIEKALTLGVDSICMDLEDGVAPANKAAARATIAAALAELDFGASEKLVRLNPFGSGLEGDDLAATLPGRPDGFVLPKVEGPEALAWLDGELTRAEQARDWPAGGLAIVILAETARGVVNLKGICQASPRLQAVIFGAEDYANSVGATRTPGAEEVLWARSAVVAHTAAFGQQAIDMVRIDFKDEAGLRAESEHGARLGFSGKQAIHPSQVGPIQTAFSPAPEAVARAQRIVQAYQASLANGQGAFAFEGQMIDAPVVKAAQRILDMGLRNAD